MADLPVFHLAVEDEPDKDTKKSPKKRKTNYKPNPKPKAQGETKESTTDDAVVTMVVGIDFGTTYSGFATVIENSSYKDGIKVNQKWPGDSAHQYKTPSMLTYDFSTPTKPKVQSWGYSATASKHTYTWFKLGLGEDQEQNQHDDKLLFEGLGAIKCPENMKYRDLVTDYLTCFYKYFLEIIRKDSLSATFSLLAFRFVIAVPAGWPDGDRQLIKSCAEKAGFGSRKGDSMTMIEEPEAAALAAFYSYESTFEGANTLKEDTNAIVVDMGGGTVDLITYIIKKRQPFAVEEACIGSGAKCGSSTIDRHFRKFMIERFGEEFTKKPERQIGPKSKFMSEFEEMKRRFDMLTDTEALTLQMDWKNEEEYDQEDGLVILQREEIEEMFKPVIENVIGLIKGQIESAKQENALPTTAIILCGGLAESEYINAQLRAFCEEYIPGAEVIVPENPWSAICRGAAMSQKKSNSFVKARRARRSYGTVILVPFIEGEHDEKDAFTHPKLGKKARKMFWHIKRNDHLQANEKYRWLKKVTIQMGGDVGYKGVIELFESDRSDAPMWRSDAGVKKLGNLTIDMSEAQSSPSKKRKSNSHSWVPAATTTRTQKIEVGQVILPKTNSVEFVARVGRKNVGTASFEYAPMSQKEDSNNDNLGDSDDDDDPNFWLHRPFENGRSYNPDSDDEDDEDEEVGDSDED